MAHVASDQRDLLLKLFIDDHVAQSNNCVWVFVKSDHFDIRRFRSLRCRESSPYQGPSTCTKVKDDNLNAEIGRLLSRRVLHFFVFYCRVGLGFVKRLCVMCLLEVAIVNLILDCLEASFLIQLVLYLIIFKCFVRCRL